MCDMKPDILRRLMHEKMIRHPLPWHAEQDWAAGVYDSTNKCVIKCINMAEAAELIDCALHYEKDSNEAAHEVATLMTTSGIEESPPCPVCGVPKEYCNGLRVGCEKRYG